MIEDILNRTQVGTQLGFIPAYSTQIVLLTLAKLQLVGDHIK
jgi:hypothetical protein